MSNSHFALIARRRRTRQSRLTCHDLRRDDDDLDDDDDADGFRRFPFFLQTLLIEHGELTVAAAISALASGLGGPSKSRGAILFIVAILSLLLLDNDVPWAQHPEHPEGHHRLLLLLYIVDSPGSSGIGYSRLPVLTNPPWTKSSL